ncbi:hypothetical protein RchiOBHm_Chr2g0124311 [Rosa chinensis]|uniref:Uncharacterized protein n=1 Tax=Rosa chinensis TaxID=74649 RepID=A0A2P6RT88_ROSCH|nr:hypothetical protein RchiOBHm_Chr2g0124311 [Rosa chinensis]
MMLKVQTLDLIFNPNMSAYKTQALSVRFNFENKLNNSLQVSVSGITFPLVIKLKHSKASSALFNSQQELTSKSKTTPLCALKHTRARASESKTSQIGAMPLPRHWVWISRRAKSMWDVN